MATVRITGELIRLVRNKIDSDHRPVEEKLDADFKFGIPDADIVEMCLVSFLASEGVQRETFDGLPAKWKYACGKLEVRTINGIEVPSPFRELNTSKSQLLHAEMVRYGGFKANGEDFAPLVAVLNTYRTAKHEMDAAHDAFKVGVMDVLGSSTTLKQAIEAWPNMHTVLPPDILARHNEVEVRAKPKKREVTAEMTDALNAHATGIKISKAILGKGNDEAS